MGVNTAAKRADAWMNECFIAGLLRLFLNLDRRLVTTPQRYPPFGE
jgi:hypothetical protein